VRRRYEDFILGKEEMKISRYDEGILKEKKRKMLI